VTCKPEVNCCNQAFTLKSRPQRSYHIGRYYTTAANIAPKESIFLILATIVLRTIPIVHNTEDQDGLRQPVMAMLV
jgi:hypothetical protein